MTRTSCLTLNLAEDDITRYAAELVAAGADIVAILEPTRPSARNPIADAVESAVLVAVRSGVDVLVGWWGFEVGRGVDGLAPVGVGAFGWVEGFGAGCHLGELISSRAQCRDVLVQIAEVAFE